ncbi:MAG TPA: biotin/lipoyl-containing protein [Dehalococcoidia bacterium]|nr:biotin/lipoyl-containing protein [Dehalococcoidia bacterium]
MAAKYRLRLGNEQHEVEVEPDHAGGYRVTVGDSTRTVSLVRIGESARYSVIIDGRPHDVFAEEAPTDYRVVVGQHHITVGTQTGRRGGAGGADSFDVDAGGEWVLKSPMAGVVREVMVAVDDEVEEGQTLIIVEAMKMQNELHARRAGQVKAVYVTAGQRVDQGTPLLVLV